MAIYSSSGGRVVFVLFVVGCAVAKIEAPCHPPLLLHRVRLRLLGLGLWECLSSRGVGFLADSQSKHLRA